MATQLRLRRGNTSQTNAFTGAMAEVTVDTDKYVIVVHDGTTPGGHPAATLSYVESAFAQANAAYESANSDLYSQETANAAFLHANGSYDHANASYEFANTLYGGSAVDNVARETANSGSLYANGAFAQANGAFEAANTKLETSGGTITGSLTINTNLQVQEKFLVANGVYTIPNEVLAQFVANTADSAQVNIKNIDSSGSAEFVATADDGTSNNYYTSVGIQGSTYQTGDILYPNDSYLLAQGDDGVLSGSNLIIGQTTTGAGDIIFTQGGLGFDNVVATFVYGEGLHLRNDIESIDEFTGSLVVQGGAGIQGNVHALDVYVNGTNVSSLISQQVTLLDGINTTQNTRISSTSTHANSAYDKANSSNVLAQAVYDFANTRFSANGGIISGDTTVTGNLTVTGTTFYANTENLFVQDNTITLNSNVTGTPTLNAGIEVNRGNQTNTSVLWNESNKAWQFTNNGTSYSNIASQSAETYANGAFLQANSAFVTANDAVPKAGGTMTGDLLMTANIEPTTSNTYYLGSPTKVWHSVYVGAGSVNIDGVVLGNTGGTLSVTDSNGETLDLTQISTTANAAGLYANGAFEQSNASYEQANSAALYANGAFTQANASYEQANSAALYANGAFTEANASYEQANSASLYANGAFTQSNASYGQANSAGSYANSAFSAANTADDKAVTSGSYANAAFEAANSGSLYANSAFLQANAAFQAANNVAPQIEPAFLKANAAFLHANGAFLEANSANTLANSKAAVYTQDTAPTGVNVDDIWIDSSSGIQYVNIRSNNATQWVEFSATGTPLNGTAGLAFSDQTMYGVDAGTDITIQQIGNGNIVLQAANTIVTGNLIANAPGKKAEFNDLSVVYFRVNTATTIANSAAVNIVASTGYYVQTPTADGYMIQATGKDNVPTRLVVDSAGTSSYSAFIGRKARGTHQNPTAAQNGDLLARFSGNGFGVSGYGVNAGGASMDVYATENYTDTARGSSLVFSATPNGTNTRTSVVTFTSNTVTITGQIYAAKGFSSVPRTVTNASSVVIDFTADSVIRVINNIGATVSFTNYFPGKQVDVWVTNTDNTSKTYTHGCTETNSTDNATTKSLPGTSSMLLKYICFGTDSANVQVAIVQG
jgi:hypothetical protein